MIIMEQTLVTAGDMSGVINSQGVHMNLVTGGGSVDAIMTGSPAGVLKLQISRDVVQLNYTGDPAGNVVNWIDYAGSKYTISAAGKFIWNIEKPGYRWLKLVWTPTGGSGLLTAGFTGKKITL